MIVQSSANNNSSNGALRTSRGKTEGAVSADKTVSLTNSHSKRILPTGNNNTCVSNTNISVADRNSKKSTSVGKNINSKMSDNITSSITTSTNTTTSQTAASTTGNGCTPVNSTTKNTSIGSSNKNVTTNSNSSNTTTTTGTQPPKPSSPILLNIDEFGLTVGSIVSVQTCWDKHYEGEVMSFDYGNKILLIKCLATSGNPTRHDVHMINLNYVKNLEKKKSGKKDAPGLTNLRGLKIPKMEERKEQAVTERKKLAKAFNSGVREEGLKLFLHLNKTMANSVTWRGTDMIVMNNVCITSPYRKENCTPNGNNSTNNNNSNGTDEANTKKSQDAVDYVKQLLERYWSEI